jgi:hypothetical protein
MLKQQKTWIWQLFNRNASGSLLLCLVLLIGLAHATATAEDEQIGVIAKPLIITDKGDSVRELLFVQQFKLAEPYSYEWSAHRREVTEGYLLVLAVDPQFCTLRQTDVPVLFVGDTPAEVANFGVNSGNLIALVPGPIDLSVSLMFFGSFELPERIDQIRGQAELGLAGQLGITPFTANEIGRAADASEPVITFESREMLHSALGDLIEQYSPEELELANQYRGRVE